MKRLPSILGALVVTAAFTACADSPTESDTHAEMAVLTAAAIGGYCPDGTTATLVGKGVPAGADQNKNGWICVGTMTSSNGKTQKRVLDDRI